MASQEIHPEVKMEQQMQLDEPSLSSELETELPPTDIRSQLIRLGALPKETVAGDSDNELMGVLSEIQKLRQMENAAAKMRRNNDLQEQCLDSLQKMLGSLKRLFEKFDVVPEAQPQN